jgi:DNA-binding response OmpR family regulator
VATILIVEDEEPVRAFLAMLLEDAGHRILLAIHGAQALDLVEEDRPDLVISDVMMPVLNGADLCRRVKGGGETSTIPVILMSAAGEWAAEGTGADAFIAKPFDLDEIEALVRRWAH